MLGEDLATEPIAIDSHRLEQITERYSDQKKLRHFLCKVCSAISPGKNSETTYTCPTCSNEWGGRVALCNTVRRLQEGNTLTCAQIWHGRWKNGYQLPPGAKRIRFRAGKRKSSTGDQVGSRMNNSNEAEAALDFNTITPEITETVPTADEMALKTIDVRRC
ncbi:hypothetical protein PPTG_09740 [Phytophthora nicotianae INRA-310]|uniref:PiggyBac transposable element-derived protein 4 C-terminal zinc-ribbon domain-containing protein n=1 Tax=Phytophthora nicotianae (strain INRA-310) TaxID=761204 RepID=W2QEC3_PHYN3|nr:hypothetical protein PPTG_09740 [Phytophthora nicotianae INRA-310]ETN10625.1 hypothetical protein PPTG_09740 [Phytophthora nicotianae INRA-310]